MPRQQQSNPWEYRLRGKNPISVEAVIPDPETASRLAQEFQEIPEVREVTYRHEGSTTRVRISFSPDALHMTRKLLDRIGQHTEDAYANQGTSVSSRSS